MSLQRQALKRRQRSRSANALDPVPRQVLRRQVVIRRLGTISWMPKLILYSVARMIHQHQHFRHIHICQHWISCLIFQLALATHRFHFEFTSISLRFHFDFNSTSLQYGCKVQSSLKGQSSHAACNLSLSKALLDDREAEHDSARGPVKLFEMQESAEMFPDVSSSLGIRRCSITKSKPWFQLEEHLRSLEDLEAEQFT